MSVFNYTKNLTLFDNYDVQIIKMIISQLNLENKNLFSFLKEINIDDLQFFWYTDNNSDVLGGFHYLSYDFKKHKYAIYLNRFFNEDEQLSYFNKMTHIILAIPTIIHELYHYWQSIKYFYIYWFLQLPLIRNFTIQKHAYLLSQYLYQNNFIQNLSIKQQVKLKCKYNISKIYFDQFEKKILQI